VGDPIDVPGSGRFVWGTVLARWREWCEGHGVLRDAGRAERQPVGGDFKESIFQGGAGVAGDDQFGIS
jgi:hypothetical protein